jgi:hypothetical protein
MTSARVVIVMHAKGTYPLIFNSRAASLARRDRSPEARRSSRGHEGCKDPCSVSAVQSPCQGSATLGRQHRC